MREFIDKNRIVINEYYDIQDNFTGKNIKKTISALEKLIQKDPCFFDSYLMIFDLLNSSGKSKEAEEIIAVGYSNALDLILDEECNWPQKLEWGWIENRHIIRLFVNVGTTLWKKGKQEEALELFEKLLKTNPNDNAGVRFYILAILEGMSLNVFNKKFDKGGFYNSEINVWFDEKVNTHKEYFNWWLRLFDE